MISEKMAKAINEQINAELYSAYLYLSMASYFDDKGLSGFAHWMKLQAQEEVEHGMKFYTYLYDRGAKVTLKAIEAPSTNWDSPLAVFKNIYEHECKVTGLIDNLYRIAKEEKDSPTEIFLHWYINEQIEEEASASEIVSKLEMIGDKTQLLLMLDKELAQRGTQN